jgi:hypothetical protein
VWSAGRSTPISRPGLLATLVPVVRALTAHGGAAGPGIALTLGRLALGVAGVLCATGYRRTVRIGRLLPVLAVR